MTRLMNDFDARPRLRINFFQPSVKLVGSPGGIPKSPGDMAKP